MTVNAPAPFIVSAFIYVIGAFGVTLICNVPMNNALAAFDAASADGLRYWSDRYLPGWTRWNSIRTVACVLASAILLFSISLAPNG